jgi:hypothetical protein
MVKNEALLPLFEGLRGLLEPYSSRLLVKVDEPGRYELYSMREVEVAGRKRDEVFFAGLIVQKDYVGLYYMPIYAEKRLEEVFSSELLKLRKGKSCFYVRKLTPELREQIAEALQAGFNLYKEWGWV